MKARRRARVHARVRHVWRPAACPPWCQTSHTTVFEDDLRQHDVEILRVDSVSGPALPARVRVVVCDDLDAGTRGAPVVDLIAEDGLLPEQARTVAFAILEAAELAERPGAAR